MSFYFYTFFFLVITINFSFFYRFFQGMVSEYVISMEEKAITLIDCIERGNNAPKRFSRIGN